MDRPRLIAAIALALLALTAAAPAARAELTAEAMLSPGTVTAIDLQLPPESVEALEDDPREYVEGSFRIAASGGTPETVGELSDPLTVGVRLKGSASFEGLDGKAAFKVKFNEFVAKQKFLGLESLTLNNMVQDPSMVHEALAYEAFRAAGLAAPRAGYAYIHLNGVDYGLHLNLETIDDVALAARFGGFGDPQHLYEGVPRLDLVPGAAAEFEVDEGDKGELSDLEALIAAANEPEPSFSERLAPVADLARMTRFWAAERYLGHWDGYSGPFISNYYLYSDPGGVFELLPSGTDQTLTHWWHPFAGSGGTLFEQCLAEPACRDAYSADLAAVASSTTALDLPALLDALAAQLAPWQEREIAESSRERHGAAAIAAGLDDVREFLAKRPAALARWLDTGEQPGGPGPDAPAPPADPPDRVPPSPFAGAPSTAAPSPVLRRLAVDRSALGRGQLLVRAEIAASGTIVLAGDFGPARERRRACATTPRGVGHGTTVLHCRLSGAARERLRTWPLTVRLAVTFQPVDGARPLTLTRLARLRRLPELRPADGYRRVGGRSRGGG